MEPSRWAQTSPTKKVMAWHLPSADQVLYWFLLTVESLLTPWISLFRSAYPALIMDHNFSVSILNIYCLTDSWNMAFSSCALWPHHLACLILLLQSPASSNTHWARNAACSHWIHATRGSPSEALIAVLVSPASSALNGKRWLVHVPSSASEWSVV